MNIDIRLMKSARTVFAVTGLVMALAPLTHAGTSEAQPAPPMTASADAAVSTGVIVKLGNASLEEYQHGDPGCRIQLLSNDNSDQHLAPMVADTYHL